MIWPDDMKAGMVTAARKRMGMKQYEFANLLAYSPRGISQWETGRRVPRGAAWQLFLLKCEDRGISFTSKGNIK
jgi:DNA-binding transcriptional regulator YiaG